MTAENKRIVFGSIENVDIPTLDIWNVQAKIDTGAYTGALHCHEIKIAEEEARQVLYFRPLDESYPMQRVENFKVIKVISASGHRSVRYAVPITMCIKGKTYKGNIGLTSRPELSKQILIGRRFLRKHKIIVDVLSTPDDYTNLQEY